MIAQAPEKERSASRLLALHRHDGAIEHASFADITRYLREGDVLVLNDTKVLPARLKGNKPTGGLVDMLLVEKIDEHRWSCLVDGAKKAVDKLDVKVGDIQVRLERKGQFWNVDFLDASADEVMATHGTMPLPHYIKRGENGMGALDAERYQTVYAETRGSIAAPTAGLHFTEELLDRISMMGVTVVKITLHIGVGTFFLVKKEHVEEHRMHREYFSVKPDIPELLRHAKARGGRVLAVGTSAARTLETLSACDYNGTTGRQRSMRWPLQWLRLAVTMAWHAPGLHGALHPPWLPVHGGRRHDHQFPSAQIDAALLVCAFAGKENIFEAYRQAMALSYRFYSYGDAMLIL